MIMNLRQLNEEKPRSMHPFIIDIISVVWWDVLDGRFLRIAVKIRTIFFANHTNFFGFAKTQGNIMFS